MNRKRFREQPNPWRVALHAGIALVLFGGSLLSAVTRHPEMRRSEGLFALLAACGVSIGYLIMVSKFLAPKRRD